MSVGTPPTSSVIKDALRLRHPGERQGSYVGQWTCLEEYMNIDLLALNAWKGGDVIGYEVKVSRSDMRSELLEPTKRALAVARCTEFYFAVPEGMMKPEEITWEEPEWPAGAFERVPCPEPCLKPWRHRRRQRKHKAMLKVPVPVVGTVRDGHGRGRWSPGWDLVLCPTCEGRGWVERSLVERYAPNLWVPKDVGLVVVRPRGHSIVIRASPKRKDAPGLALLDERARGYDKTGAIQRQNINDLVRWASNRPDPRHR